MAGRRTAARGAFPSGNTKIDFRRHPRPDAYVPAYAIRRTSAMLDDVDNRDTTGNPRVDGLMSSRIGFIGLGLMGTAMAANLAADGCNVRAYLRRPGRINDLQALGVPAKTRRPGLFAGD